MPSFATPNSLLQARAWPLLGPRVTRPSRAPSLKGSNSVESETLLRRAASYYVIAIRGQVQGETAVRVAAGASVTVRPGAVGGGEVGARTVARSRCRMSRA